LVGIDPPPSTTFTRSRAPRWAAYLASLTPARLVLWCYLLWYLVIVLRYFDPSPRLWLTSLGLSVIIGVALLLNAGWRGRRGALDRWQTARFFMMPFAVSSFSALVKGQGFVLVFSPRWPEVATGVAVCATFVLAARQARRSLGR
jgi:hypothetical protein